MLPSGYFATLRCGPLTTASLGPWVAKLTAHLGPAPPTVPGTR